MTHANFSNSSPPAKVVAEFHRNSDVNQRLESQHHTLGTGRYEAARGDHTHDGSTGTPLLSGLTLTGDLNDPSKVPGILKTLFSALAEKLGAKDATTQASTGKAFSYQFGTSQVSWSGTSTWSAATTVPLTVGLFSASPFIFLTRIGVNPGGGRNCDYRVTSRSATSFTWDAALGGGDTAGAGVTLTTMWAAFGERNVG